MTFDDIKSREKLAWAAGIFEGEGCFCFSASIKSQKGRGPLHASVKMTDEDVVRRFHSIIGLGAVYTVKSRAKKLNGEYRKQQWCWQVGSFEDFQAVVAMLWSWLYSRRRAKAKDILTRYHALEPISTKISRERSVKVRAALATIADRPLWGRRWEPGRTQKSIAREFGLSTGMVTLLKPKDGALRLSTT